MGEDVKFVEVTLPLDAAIDVSVAMLKSIRDSLESEMDGLDMTEELKDATRTLIRDAWKEALGE